MNFEIPNTSFPFTVMHKMSHQFGFA
ncbi:MAG: hypothetical protein ACMUEM_01840 [Flavobacteriales bacterium AspAUS03]